MEHEYKVISVEKNFEQWKVKIQRKFEVDRGAFGGEPYMSSETFTTKSSIKLEVGSTVKIDPTAWVIKEIPWSFLDDEGVEKHIKIRELLRMK